MSCAGSALDRFGFFRDLEKELARLEASLRGD
jgi:hypothetical protein